MSQAQDPVLQSLKEYTSKKIAKDLKDTSSHLWKVGALCSFNLSTGSLSNWSAGGDDFSLSANGYINAHAFYNKGKHRWDNVMEINLGYINTTTLGSRKNDDRVDVLSKYGYRLKEKLSLTGLFNFRSQFFRGYTFDIDADGKTRSSLSSNFLAPAYVLVGIGFDYREIPRLSVFISPLTSRWTIVKDVSLSAKGAYGVDTGRKGKSALGAYASINYSTDFNKIVGYSGRADLFSNYKFRPKNIDLYITNLVTIKLSKILSATWNVDLIYDDDVKVFGPGRNSPRLQFKSLVGIGLLVRF
ncbi:MAG: DUF3078 domain-containing protein [Chitinophagaceae bacterium]